MRILIADSYYGPFVAQHYAANPGLERRPYADQLASLQSRHFGVGDSYSRTLRGLGHHAAEIIVNCEPLQRRWAEENGGAWSRLRRALRAGTADRRADLHVIATRQIESFAPDVLYVQDLSFFDREELDRLRQAGILIAGQIASGPPPEPVLRGYDLLVTSFPHYVARFEGLGIRARYLPLAFDPIVLERLRAAGGPNADSRGERPYQVSFVGGVDPEVHPGRVALLERVASEIGIETWGYGAERLPTGSPLRDRHHGEAWGLDMYGVIAASRILINTHIEAAEGHANNMRLFEGTGCGALVVTEDAPNLGRLFEPGRELLTYTSPDDLVEKVRDQLRDDEGRRRIAAAGQARTLFEHTYERRLAELAEVLEELLAGQPPSSRRTAAKLE